MVGSGIARRSPSPATRRRRARLPPTSSRQAAQPGVGGRRSRTERATAEFVAAVKAGDKDHAPLRAHPSVLREGRAGRRVVQRPRPQDRYALGMTPATAPKTSPASTASSATCGRRMSRSATPGQGDRSRRRSREEEHPRAIAKTADQLPTDVRALKAEVDKPMDFNFGHTAVRKAAPGPHRRGRCQPRSPVKDRYSHRPVGLRRQRRGRSAADRRTAADHREEGPGPDGPRSPSKVRGDHRIHRPPHARATSLRDGRRGDPQVAVAQIDALSSTLSKVPAVLGS